MTRIIRSSMERCDPIIRYRLVHVSMGADERLHDIKVAIPRSNNEKSVSCSFFSLVDVPSISDENPHKLDVALPCRVKRTRDTPFCGRWRWAHCLRSAHAGLERCPKV